MGFVIPILAGVWADSRLGTKPLLLLAGFALGLTVGMVQLLQIVRENGRRRPQAPPESAQGKAQD